MMYFLINVKDEEICDVIAQSLKNAKFNAASFLGGASEDWVERWEYLKQKKCMKKGNQ